MERTPENTPQLNLSYIEDIAGGKKDFIINLLRTIAKSLREQPKLISDAFAAKDLAKVREMAHKLKSSTAYLGYKQFDEILSRIETSEANSLPQEEVALLVEQTKSLSGIFVKLISEKITELILAS